MAVLRLSMIHDAHVARICSTWAEGPSSDDPDEAAFLPMLLAVYRDPAKRTKERVMVARAPEERVEAAEALGRALARDRAKPFAVTQASEAWGAPDDGGGRPSGRADRVEVLGIATAQADGRTLTTVCRIVRSEGGEAALGETLVDAESGVEARLSEAVSASYKMHNNGYGGSETSAKASLFHRGEVVREARCAPRACEGRYVGVGMRCAVDFRHPPRPPWPPPPCPRSTPSTSRS